MISRQKVAMVVAELMGVVVLALAVYAMVGRTTFPLFAGLAAGTVLALLVHTIGATSGAHVNPAVTLGLWSVRKVKTTQAIIYIAVQMLGGLAAWKLAEYFLGSDLQSLAGETFSWKVLWAELAGTFIFGFGIASAVYQKYEGGKLAFTVGASLTVGILVASLASNGVLNPAVAVGLQSWSWAYAAGPIAGSILGMNVYAILFTDEISFKRPKLARAKAAPAAVKKPIKKVAAKKTTTKKTTKKRK